LKPIIFVFIEVPSQIFDLDFFKNLLIPFAVDKSVSWPMPLVCVCDVVFWSFYFILIKIRTIIFGPKSV